MLKSLSNTPVSGRIVAFFSLPLVRANFADYIKEAWRTLKVDGVLHIWEATSRFADPKRFARDLSRLGFKAFEPEERGWFNYNQTLKPPREPVEGAAVRFRDQAQVWPENTSLLGKYLVTWSLQLLDSSWMNLARSASVAFRSRKWSVTSAHSI
jgi:hypothetical protein